MIDKHFDALEALERIERGGVDPEGPDRDIYTIRRFITEPAVPDALWGLLRSVIPLVEHHVREGSDSMEGIRYWQEWKERAEHALAQQGEDSISEKYYDLLYAVETKHPGETRHKTALRYIQQAENRPAHCAATKPDSGEGDD